VELVKNPWNLFAGKKWEDNCWVAEEMMEGLTAQVWISTFGLPRGRVEKLRAVWCSRLNEVFAIHLIGGCNRTSSKRKLLPSGSFSLFLPGEFLRDSTLIQWISYCGSGASPEMCGCKGISGNLGIHGRHEKRRWFDSGVNTGIYTSEPGPGGNSLINRFHSKGPVGDYEGLLIMTWDPKEKAYKAYVFGNDFPGGIIETGNFEGDALVFRGEITMGETKVLMRNSTKFEDNGKLTADQFMSVGPPEALLVRVAAKRKQ
jgi:hypothetical protein